LVGSRLAISDRDTERTGDKMKEVNIQLSDDEWHTLEKAAHTLGVSAEELLRSSVAEYVATLQKAPPFEPIGFGMWADRPEMCDAAQWVHERRGRGRAR
jgi:HPt (histidine-containing phosphotransfer) domain-containing protein